MIRSIRLQHFRSYSDARYEFSPGVTIIAGPNGSGKTNLLEAVLLAAQGGSYRAKDPELIRHGQPWARLDAETHNGRRTVKLTAQPAQKIFDFEGQVLRRLSPQRRLPVVLFEPNHMLLFTGAPELRRAFLDDLLEQTVPRYGEYRRHYKRVLSQRNALLKNNLPGQLFVWNIRLSELGGKIARERVRLVGELGRQVSQTYSEIAGKATEVSLAYSTQFSIDSYETALLTKLEQSTDLDLIRGFTASGPHRDDLTAAISGKPVQETASRGENRTLVLSLKILELEIAQNGRGQNPILLLDDVFSELDTARRAALARCVTTQQTIITTTNGDIASRLPAAASVITLE